MGGWKIENMDIFMGNFCTPFHTLIHLCDFESCPSNIQEAPFLKIFITLWINLEGHFLEKWGVWFPLGIPIITTSENKFNLTHKILEISKWKSWNKCRGGGWKKFKS